MLRYSALILAATVLLTSITRGEEIDVKWEIETKSGNFFAKTLVPEGAKAKVTVVKIDKECLIGFHPKFQTADVKTVGDRVNHTIGKEPLEISSPSLGTKGGGAIKADGNKLTFRNGLTIKVVVED